jgi:hypothetical protein
MRDRRQASHGRVPTAQNGRAVDDKLLELEKRVLKVELRVTDLLRRIEDRRDAGKPTHLLEVNLRSAQALRDVLYSHRARVVARQPEEPDPS